MGFCELGEREWVRGQETPTSESDNEKNLIDFDKEKERKTCL